MQPGEPLGFTGVVEVAVVQGCLRVLGFDLRAPQASSGTLEWHTIHSPAGGLIASLEAASIVSSGAKVVLRRAKLSTRVGEKRVLADGSAAYHFGASFVIPVREHALDL